MLLISVVVDPPRIAIRVGTRFVCLSSSLFKACRLRRMSPTAMGNLRAFRTSDCNVVSGPTETSIHSATDAEELCHLSQAEKIRNCGAVHDLCGRDRNTATSVSQRD